MAEELSELESKLLERLGELAQRYDALSQQMSSPEVAGNAARMTSLLKAQGRLRRFMEPYRKLQQITKEIVDSRAILADAGADKDLQEMAREELAQLQKHRSQVLEDATDAMLTDEEASISSVLLEIRAGTGGEEAALFARDLFEMYQRYAARKGYNFEVMDCSTSERGGFREVIVNIKGEGVYQEFGYEGGGHRVQRVPETEAQGRIHTSAATVAVLPEPDDIDIKIDWDKDVLEHVSRAGGPGGQNVNKVSSAIKLEHIETGITVSMRDEKSQHKNRAKARRILASRLYDHFRSKQQNQIDRARRTMIGSGDRSQRIRTYNFPQNRVTDHRINLDLYKLDLIMQGELDEVVAALKLHDRQKRLQSLAQLDAGPLAEPVHRGPGHAS
jgi:peptide chain release factor 1